MRWFFAVNENSPGFWDYLNLVQVAVHSARRHTSLEPVCIYDGEENVLTAWLREARVPVIRRATFLGAITVQLSPILRGSYLRLEVPAICAEHGWTDEWALYTDVDVMFVRDPVPMIERIRPRFLAAAPESDRSDFARFNCGVMLINVRAWSAEMPAITETFRTMMAEMGATPDDQVLLQRHFAGRTDRLPLGLNWKSYWVRTEETAIVHFHGPKPAQKYVLLNGRGPAELQRLTNAPYFEAALAWDRELIQAATELPLPAVAGVRRVEPGFEGFDEITGIGVPEGPFPAFMLPVVRWGLAPATEVTFTVPPGARAELEASFQCPHTDQEVTIAIGEKELARVPIRRVSDPHSAFVPLPVGPGQHRVTLTYARSYPQSNGDPRLLAVLYRAIRIRFTPGGGA